MADPSAVPVARVHDLFDYTENGRMMGLEPPPPIFGVEYASNEEEDSHQRVR